MTKAEKRALNEEQAGRFKRRDRKARKKQRAQRVAGRDAVWLAVMGIG